MTKDKLTGAELVIRGLEYLNVSTVFGVPGGAILPAYDPLYDSPIRHILARHEQGAGHMAEGYAQSTGELGVVIATSGPGATNLITPLANALMDSTPLLAITGQVASDAIGNDAFQEAYTVGLSMAATKHNYLITDAGMHTLIRPALYKAHHEIESVSGNTQKPTDYTIAGPICESSDIFGKNINLPQQQIGNLIIIKDTGAYGKVMASNYNSRGLPKEILVKDNNFFVIHKPLSTKEYIDQDRIPDWLV